MFKFPKYFSILNSKIGYVSEIDFVLGGFGNAFPESPKIFFKKANRGFFENIFSGAP